MDREETCHYFELFYEASADLSFSALPCEINREKNKGFYP